MDRRLWRQAAVAAAAAMAVAGLGSALTDLGPWYRSLVQPAWKPPDAAFGPVWTTIFTLAAIAGVRGWRAARSTAERRLLLGLFAVNGVLNALWSLLYFRLRRPDWALAEVGLLWLSVAALIVVLLRRSPLAAWLLVPYLVWVAVAAGLNFEAVGLNGPFDGT